MQPTLQILVPSQTIGGFKITEFELLKEPINRGGFLAPHIYSGLVHNVTNGKYPNRTYLITWDENGRCLNWDRPDCFIQIIKK